MQITHKPIVISALYLGIVACTPSVQDEAFTPSDNLQPYTQSSYAVYLSETEKWLYENRVFLTDNKQTELSAVAPFEVIPKNPNGQGILLVHGLGDSPYSYSDIAPVLANQGYLVRVILLPGHGTRAADLALPQLEDWQNVVSHHYQLLNAEVDGVWLGGFSTGANLVTTLAYQEPTIKGLLLFSPAFMPLDPMAKITPYVSWFMDWAELKEENNYTRYNSLHINGAAVYYRSTEVVRDYIKKAPYTQPTFVMLSESDETIDAHYAAQQFSEKFTNPNNRLLWFGEQDLADPRATRYSMNMPEKKYLSASHISLVYAPSNPVYKKDGEIRLCFNEQPAGTPDNCADVPSDQVWFAAFGDGDDSMIRARMSWNPYFDQSMQQMSAFLAENNQLTSDN